MREHGDPGPKREDRSSKPTPGNAELPNAIVLTGYVEPGSRAGYVRLYLDTTMRSYIDVPESEIRHREDGGGEESSVGPKTTLWIRRGALLDYTTAKSWPSPGRPT